MTVGLNGYRAGLALPQLTPRKDRLEAAILGVLRAGGTRSELRELVSEFADYLQMCGVAVDDATSTLRALGTRATPFMNQHGQTAVGDSATDRITMMVRWCADQYRAD